MNLLAPAELARYIDHTFLKTNGSPELIEKLCAEAKEFGFAMVAVNPAEVRRCASLLKGCTTRVGAAIGFPLGQNTVATKMFEIEDAISCGAGEIDMVINQRALQAGNLDLVGEELYRLTEICKKHSVISKIILECCNLTDDEKIAVCKIATDAGCDFVKTSTGFAAHGATVPDVQLMKRHVSGGVQVKAAGGIRSLETALQMIAAGATRLGTSAGVEIVKELVDRERRTSGSEAYLDETDHNLSSRSPWNPAQWRDDSRELPRGF